MEMIEICILQCNAFFFTFYVKNNKIEYFMAILLMHKITKDYQNDITII